MTALRSLILCAAASGLAACSYSARPNASRDGSHSPYRHVTPADSFLYAQLALNAYGKSNHHFRFPGNAVTLVKRYPSAEAGSLRDLGDGRGPITGHPSNDIFGLAFDVYEHRRTDGLVDTIFAFRGTEGGSDRKSCDFRYGNLSSIQQRRATELVADYLALHSVVPERLIFTGHSLGGGIARHVSMRFPNAGTFAFNSSPVFRAPAGYVPRNDPTDRYSINASGEILKVARLFGPEPTQTYWKVDCALTGDPVDKHSMALLAWCLTVEAARQDVLPLRSGQDLREFAALSAADPANAWAATMTEDEPTSTYPCPR